MNVIPGSPFESFIDACRRIAAYGLVRATSGNLSLRLDDEQMLVTASGAGLADITENHVAVVRLSDGFLLDGPKPSAETGLHRGVLNTRTDLNAALHFQSPAATAIACRKSLPGCFFVIPEIPYYIGEIASVPYLKPGSPELAEAVASAMERHDLVLLRNHGQVTAGKDLDDAIKKAVFFELACEILLKTGGNADCLSKKAVDSLCRSK